MVLKPVVEKILELSDDNVRSDYAKALMDSIKLDTTRNQPKPKSPQQIAELHGVDIEDQVEYGISLTKQGAVQFLARYGKRIKKERFNRRVTANRYKSVFGRKVSRLGLKSLVLTYAEVQHITKFGNQIPYPTELKRYL